jgi:hypothetical protein
MSNIALTAVLALVGIALLVGGMFIYRTGLKLFGFLLGGGLGFFAGSAIGVGPIPTIAIIAVLGFVGLAIAEKVYLIMLIVPGGATGFGAALIYTGTSMDPLTNLLDPVILSAPIIGAVAAVLLQRIVVVFVSAAWGAYLLWAAVATDAIVETLTSLSIPTPPLWANALIGVGVVAQAVTWYLTKRYDDDELAAKVKGLLGLGASGGQPEGGA